MRIKLLFAAIAIFAISAIAAPPPAKAVRETSCIHCHGGELFDDAGKAAGCALDLQEALAATDLTAHGLPATMGLRIGGHLGPVYTARDPVLRRDNFFGAHVSRAARIEPVTPERCVYVTETLAAVLALHNADAFECEYVGMTKAAKHYGRMRMFLLRRAAG